MMRRVLILILCVLAGMFLSLASALASACWGESAWTNVAPTIPARPLPAYLDPLDVEIESFYDHEGTGRGFSRRAWVGTVEHFVDPTGNRIKLSFVRHRFGWPFRSMYIDSLYPTPWSRAAATWLRSDLRKEFLALAGCRTEDADCLVPTFFPRWIPSRRNPRQIEAVPRAVNWPGFLANTGVYSAVAWLILFTPIIARRIHRRRRGRCVTCGYELAGLGTCPECGSAR